ncbi:uncharacterized protein G2W53_017535 [Senna tora]|uniref:Uncharacterized protein n=1 Tax=Senna tora TaxID=362788 RepID=A0A834WP26_9FABA|nr:uncharacterized protein G2W53_017535 [Senna tora]
MVDLEASMKNQMTTMENQIVDFGKQCETHQSTVFSNVDQMKTNHDSLSEFVSPSEGKRHRESPRAKQKAVEREVGRPGTPGVGLLMKPGEPPNPAVSAVKRHRKTTISLAVSSATKPMPFPSNPFYIPPLHQNPNPSQPSATTTALANGKARHQSQQVLQNTKSLKLNLILLPNQDLWYFLKSIHHRLKIGLETRPSRTPISDP